MNTDEANVSAEERNRFAELVRSRRPESIETLFGRIESMEQPNIPFFRRQGGAA